MLKSYNKELPQTKITLMKNQPEITLDEIRRRVKEAGEDPNQPTLEEISQIVKKVRKENENKKP